MKKISIILAAAVAILATGCAKNEVLESTSKSYAIAFDAYANKATKASETTATTLQGEADALYVNCYLGAAPANPGQFADYFGDALDYDGTSKWDTTPTRYWPLGAVEAVTSTPTACLSFFAYSNPANNTGLTYNGTNYKAATTAYPTLSYTVANLAADQKDIVAAVPVEKQTYNSLTTHGQAALQFKHILSQIRVKVWGQTSDYKYKVTAVTLGADLDGTANSELLYNSGVYTFAAAGGSVAANTASGATKDAYTYPAAGTPAFHTFANGSSDAIFLGSETATAGSVLMLMPQTIATGANNTDKAAISVTYQVTDANDVPIYSGTKRVAISTSGATAWEQGKRYTYILKLTDSEYPITYSVTVGTWTDATDVAITVQ